jgi:hypothetical protein
MGAGATFDWLFFDNSKLIDFERERERERERKNLT